MSIGRLQRREFIATLVGAAATWPTAARTQQPGERKRRIGILTALAENDPEISPRLGGLRQALQALGWTDGGNLGMDIRFAGGDADRMRTQAVELIGMTPDGLLAAGGPATAALRRATRTIPIVFVQVVDAVGAGFVANLARPGGNITGFTTFEYAVSGKWLGALKEIAPQVIRVAILYSAGHATGPGHLGAIQAVVPSLSVQLTPMAIFDATEIEPAIKTFARDPNGGLIVLPGALVAAHRTEIIALAAQHRLPAIYPYRYYVASGGLVSYGVDTVDQYRRAASYLDRILRGTNPAELPVQASTKYELVINLKTAKALGLEVPPTLLARADEVIE
jgi:putative tryptophan/tyrosine transport system substrate-binding protein